MTTIAFKDGILAADSRETSGCEDSGQLAATCEKMFRVGPFVVALQGDTTPGMVWLHWFRGEYGDHPRDAEAALERILRQPYPTDADLATFAKAYAKLKHTPADIIDRFLEHEADFTAVVFGPGGLHIYDEWGLPQKITAPYYAVGSGTKVACGAMHAGAGAVAAVEAACAHDPYTAGPVHSSENL